MSPNPFKSGLMSNEPRIDNNGARVSFNLRNNMCRLCVKQPENRTGIS